MQDEGSNPKGIGIAIIVVLLLAAGFFIYNKNISSKTVIAPEPSSGVGSIAEISSMSEASASPKVIEEMAITLLELNKSSQAGVATLQDLGDRTKIQLRVAGATAGAQPVSIYNGICQRVGYLKYQLPDLVNGLSEVILNVPLSKIKSELPLTINIHKSKDELGITTACGDLR